MVPFFKTLAIYFVVFIPVDEPSVVGAVLKVLPILSLIAFVLLHGMSLGDEYSYARRIFFGLVFSAVADVLLVWPEYFLHGLCTFFFTQIFYISAYGFTPLKLKIAAVIYAVLLVVMSLILPNTEGVLKIGILVYGITLSTMVWRAVARVEAVSELRTWTKLCSCVGGVLFVTSDICLGINEFSVRIPHSQLIIMSTYYAAQLCISLSVVDCKASYLDALKLEQTVQASRSCAAQELSGHSKLRAGEPAKLD